MRYIHKQFLAQTSAALLTSLDTERDDNNLVATSIQRTSDFTSGAADYMVIFTTQKV